LAAGDANASALGDGLPPSELGIHPMTAALAITANRITALLAMISIGWVRVFGTLLIGMFIFFSFW
jgi:hypothetical protein